MAKKDFDEYYNKIAKQYYSLNEVLTDLSKEVQDNMVEPERLDQLKKTIEPVKNSYQTLMYIKYLLNKPSKKQKQNKYDKQMKKIIKQSEGKHSTDIIKNNEDIISSLKI